MEVKTPEYLEYPILQTRVKTKDGYRTVAPLGSWTGVYSSTELYNAKDNFGYELKILRGYLFERAILFKDFIDYFFKMKSNSSKTDPRYFIAKLLMNSLYGKMGQSYKFEQHVLVKEDRLLQMIQNKDFEISSLIDLGSINNEGLTLVSFLNNNNKSIISNFKGSIPIASEVAALSRTLMSTIFSHLVKNDYTIYYTDTDSIVVDKPLPEWMVGTNELGKMKLEYFVEEGLFLAPKVYALKLGNGEEVIKIKGLSKDTINNELNFDLMKSLLNKDSSLVLNQIKSFRSFSDTTINLIDQTYKLIPTDNKRQLIYDINNQLIGTKPYIITSEKSIN